MIEEILKSILPDLQSELAETNDTYDFQIKIGQSKELGFQIVFTDGLSKHIQKVKEGCEEFKNIEIYFCLESYFDIKTNPWPVEWLNKIAEIPQKNNTWFGPGDTIPAGKPPELLAEGFPANHFMLCEPITFSSLFENEKWKEIDVSFLGLIPISQTEVNYKLRNSATVLLGRLKYKGYSEKVDFFRSSVCRKRFLGF